MTNEKRKVVKFPVRNRDLTIDKSGRGYKLKKITGNVYFAPGVNDTDFEIKEIGGSIRIRGDNNKIKVTENIGGIVSIDGSNNAVNAAKINDMVVIYNGIGNNVVAGVIGNAEVYESGEPDPDKFLWGDVAINNGEGNVVDSASIAGDVWIDGKGNAIHSRVIAGDACLYGRSNKLSARFIGDNARIVQSAQDCEIKSRTIAGDAFIADGRGNVIDADSVEGESVLAAETLSCSIRSGKAAIKSKRNRKEVKMKRVTFKLGQKAAAVVFMLILAGGIWAATAPALALWTGRRVYVKTVTGKVKVNCEYRYQSRTFWRVYDFVCPATIEVE